jgi:multisubunit Na+/H+ antiporter MnhF subunit
MLDILILIIGLAIFISFLRFLKGPNLEDRVVSFDVMSVISISLLVLLSITLKEPFYLDIAFVFALIGFIGVIIFARFNIVQSSNA